ncbi:MAG: phosphatase PAP2 family protein [Candidatus Poribacteria bacterium]|nr:phosphatase PAP2 family protein [Candidatus Poribacteria bacterium]
MNFLPYDSVAIGYLAFTGVLILIFRKNVARWSLYLLTRVLAIIGIVSLTFANEDTPLILQFLRDWYPLSTIALFYFEIKKLTQMVFQRYFDETVIRWEKRVFKGMPCLELSDRFPSIILSEILHLCYFSYYVMTVFLAAWLYFSGRIGPFQETVFAETLAFNLSLLCYPFLPTTGPRYLFEKIQGPLSEGFCFRLAHLAVSRGSSKGTAFPSSHISLSVTVLLCALRYDSTAFLMLLPMCVGLTLGTIYGRFHYVIDAIAGAILAGIVFGITTLLF